MVGAFLSLAGCIPSSANFPYRGPGHQTDAGAGDSERGPDVGDLVSDACAPPSDEELCEINGAQCDFITATDPCGTSRSVDCGTCMNGARCDLDHQCCQQENDVDFCARYSAECGTLEARDDCGVLRTASCGTCPGNPDDCTGTTCGDCVPETDAQTCERLSRECGTLDTPTNNCGEARPDIDCGNCQDTNGKECDERGFCICPGGLRESVCDDGFDNDCDGRTDCEDDDDCDGKKCGGTDIVPLRCNNSRCPLG